MNSEVIIDAKPVLWELFLSSGIVFVNDILDGTGKIFSHHQFCSLYGQICNNFTFNQLLSAIPINWKRSSIAQYKMGEISSTEEWDYIKL